MSRRRKLSRIFYREVATGKIKREEEWKESGILIHFIPGSFERVYRIGTTWLNEKELEKFYEFIDQDISKNLLEENSYEKKIQEFLDDYSYRYFLKYDDYFLLEEGWDK